MNVPLSHKHWVSDELHDPTSALAKHVVAQAERQIVSDGLDMSATRRRTGKTLACQKRGKGGRGDRKQGEEGNCEAHRDGWGLWGVKLELAVAVPTLSLLYSQPPNTRQANKDDPRVIRCPVKGKSEPKLHTDKGNPLNSHKDLHVVYF